MWECAAAHRVDRRTDNSPQLTIKPTNPLSNQQGQKGIVANYLTRSQVLRRLQISLRDFRCVEVRVFMLR